MTRFRFAAAIAALSLLPGACRPAQTPQPAPPQIDAATVKPSNPTDQRGGFQIRDGGRRVYIENFTLATLLAIVYHVQESQLLNLPGWAHTEHFDIQAVAANGQTPTGPQWEEMTKSLLVARCGLRVHDETRDLPIDSLTVDKHGLKLKPSARGKSDYTDDTMMSPGKLRETNVTMASFARRLGDFVQRPVIDNTGLGDQRYDFTLQWQDSMQDGGAPASDAAALPDLRTALAEQAGLRLTGTHGPAPVVVVDALNRPTPN